jgi:hypothetical protein
LLPERRVHLRIRFIAALTIILATIPLHASAQSGKKAFVSSWKDQTVVLRQTLYSLIFDERSRIAPILKRQNRVSGLTVGTSRDTYYQFDARRSSEQDVVDKDPNRIVSRLQEQYHRSEHLDIGNTQDVETVMLVRYEPGVELFVRDVQFERDHTRLVLHKDRKGDLATTLTVKWPVPLSAELTESALIDSVLSRFITRK